MAYHEMDDDKVWIDPDSSVKIDDMSDDLHSSFFDGETECIDTFDNEDIANPHDFDQDMMF